MRMIRRSERFQRLEGDRDHIGYKMTANTKRQDKRWLELQDDRNHRNHRISMQLMQLIDDAARRQAVMP